MYKLIIASTKLCYEGVKELFTAIKDNNRLTGLELGII